LTKMRDNEKSNVDRSVAAAERTLLILDAFIGNATSLGLGDIAEATGLFKSVILRYMISLEEFGYVRKLGDGRYQLGMRALQLGYSYSRSVDLTQSIAPVLDRLVAATGESAFFYIREGSHRICFMGRDSPHTLRVSAKLGVLMPLDETSMSQVLRDFSEPNAEQLSLPKGYFRTSAGINDPLTSSLSVPVFGVGGRLMGALALSGPIGRFDVTDQRTRGELLREAMQLSLEIGGAEAGRQYSDVTVVNQGTVTA
jgi:DNA-binding IclR family transcriptional regulator